MGTIIGYYFGQRPVKGLTDRVEDLTTTQANTIQKFEEAEKELRITSEKYAKERTKFKETYRILEELYETRKKEKTKQKQTKIIEWGLQLSAEEEETAEERSKKKAKKHLEKYKADVEAD